uniref:Cytochrome P450 n=1 Tax=Angiostrongylus cantonensis TaxID=6313 RepID=A0A0K0D687_ANGCA
LEAVELDSHRHFVDAYRASPSFQSTPLRKSSSATDWSGVVAEVTRKNSKVSFLTGYAVAVITVVVRWNPGVRLTKIGPNLHHHGQSQPVWIRGKFATM